MVGLRSCYLILGDFSHALLVFHAMFRMRMGYFISPVILWFNLKLIAIFGKVGCILRFHIMFTLTYKKSTRIHLVEHCNFHMLPK